MRRFDVKFGPDLLETVPTGPGVYRFHDAAGAVIYVGKATSLRRRLAQYRMAGPGKRGKKPRKIVKDATEISWDPMDSELDACLEEVRLIQALRPRHNVASAFEFLYPFIGVCDAPGQWRLCLTTKPDAFPEYRFHAAFRSREVTALGFFSLVRLLRHVAHQEPKARVAAEAKRDEHSHVVAFRQVPKVAPPLWERFFRGDDAAAAGDLAVRLLEKPSARHKASEIQTDLKTLRAFYVAEAEPLRQAVQATAHDSWPVPQRERDPLFLRYRALRA